MQIKFGQHAILLKGKTTYKTYKLIASPTALIFLQLFKDISPYNHAALQSLHEAS